MSTPAGWYPDPTGRHQNRYFDGNDWTDQVANGQAVSTDPVQGGGAAAATQATPAATPDPGATTSVPIMTGPAPGAPGATSGPPAGAPGGPPPGAPGGPPPGAPGGPPPGAPGGPPPGGTSPLGAYASPGGSSSGGSGKKVLAIVAVLILIAVVVGLVLTLGGGDDGGGEAADFSSEPDDDDDDSPTTTDDPSASDLFDDMADTDEGGDDIFGTEDEPADDPADDTVPPEDSGGDSYPPEVIDNFTSSCEGAGSTATFCNCVINVLQRDVPYDRFVEIDQQLAEDSSSIPTELTDAATECQ